MFQVTLTQVNFPVKNFFVPRDDPKIWRLYNGLSCTELCNGDEGQCVVPSTPGNLTSACPNGAAKQFPRRVAKRKTREGDEKERNDNRRRADRLVGPSTLHTHTRKQAMRYPWICSLKTQGFRWNMITSEKLIYSGVATSVHWPFSLPHQKKQFWWRPHIATTSAKVDPSFWSLAAADHLTNLAHVLR